MSKINVHNGWDPLEEIWLGDVWPKEFYEDLNPEIRQAFRTVTDWTKEDLYQIQKKFEELGIVVRRPYIDINNKQKYLNPNGTLLKPPICLRDDNAVIGNKLFFNQPKFSNLKNFYDHDCLFVPEGMTMISGASMVKIGRDILFDSPVVEQQPKENIFYNFYCFEKNIIKNFSKDYRIYYATNGGHCDGCFMPIKFGVSLSTVYATGYDFFLPKWQTVDLKNPTYIHHSRIGNPGIHWNQPKWYVPNMVGGPSFNEYVEKYCQSWIGFYTETFFEVNVVAIDEENLVCIGDEKNAYPYVKEIEKHGIKCHLVPFRTRSFWDGGIHCITLDTKRKGTLKDYYPDRGEMGFKGIYSNNFSNTEKFMEEYNDWKIQKKIK